MTQMDYARKGDITNEIRAVAEYENLPIEKVIERVAEGTICIPKNIYHKLSIVRGVGSGLKTKVNANMGTSKDYCNLEEELKKIDVAVKAGADAVMDLSTGGDIKSIRQAMIDHSPVMVGTVPIYEAAAVEQYRDGGAVVNMKEEDLFKVIESQAEQGVDFMTLHCGVTRQSVEMLRGHKRICDVVSRGGSFLVAWILHNDKENPLYEHYDRVLEIAKKYDITLSLGDGFRPGCLADATDRGQIQELLILGDLVRRAREAGVQTMVEGPGHVPLNQIVTNMQLQKRLCEGAPFYVLGPLVTDIAPGYDHITCAIGGAIAACNGADFLCYVTPSEHLALPTVQDVEDGVIATKIAGHAADIAKGIPGAMDWDNEMAVARKKRDWDAQYRLAINPERAKKVRSERISEDDKVCSMCSGLCAIKMVEDYLNKL
ncbi:MAG: phosphomethylpyrimidine synthase ThiC [Armatimonadetes bacterium]|nr:phosphomethylpyrimidine synthase ThiC [Candidatus Hippobium faecium]